MSDPGAPWKLLTTPKGSLLGSLLRAPLRLLPRERDVRVLSGPTRGMRWRVGSSTHGCWLGTYEAEKVQALMAFVRPGMTVFDVGANAGFYTLAFSRGVGPTGRVVAFEPFAENVVNLLHHIQVNALGNCSLMQCALSSSTGLSGFVPGPSNSMGALGEGDTMLKVPTVSIDELIASQSVPLPQLVKMDVEGAEGDVLAGAAQTLSLGQARWFIALHGNEAKRQCNERLREKGYRIFGLDGKELTAPLESLSVDEIYAERPGTQG